jgi:ABC-type Zn2+ transport system, periplasmic component/surface adhesin
MKVGFYTFIILLILFFSEANAGSKLNVVVTIKPYHSLVSAVMLGVSRPVLLLKGNLSPHGYSLKPSDVKRLQYADIIFWGGKNLEGFLAKPLNLLSKKAKVISMIGLSGLKLKYFRAVSKMGKNDNFESNISDFFIYKDYEIKSAIDPHIWLDPENAKLITSRIVDIFSNMIQKIVKNTQ